MIPAFSSGPSRVLPLAWAGLLVSLTSLLTARSLWAQNASFTVPTPAPAADTAAPASASDAGRLLIQATFGPTDDALAEVERKGVAKYLHRQMVKVPASSHVAYLDQVGVDPAAKNVNPTM